MTTATYMAKTIYPAIYLSNAPACVKWNPRRKWSVLRAADRRHLVAVISHGAPDSKEKLPANVTTEDICDLDAPTIPGPRAMSCEHTGMRRRSTKHNGATASPIGFPKEACKEHRSIARSRYDEYVWPPLDASARRCSLGVSNPAPHPVHCVDEEPPFCQPLLLKCVDAEKTAILADVDINVIEKGAVAARERAVLAIKGMTCTGCENKLIRTLKTIEAIQNVKTSLVLCRAEFDFDSGATELQALVQLIEKRSGFAAEIIRDASTRELLLTVDRTVCEKFMLLSRPDGVEDIVRCNATTLSVIYDPRTIGARNVIEAYGAFSPSLAPVPRDPALTAGVKHIRSLALRTVVSAALTIPVLVMAWAPLRSIRGLETELLIVLSTTAAYVYSVVAFAFDMIGQPLASGEFFETSTLLVTLIMVGQVVSAVARQRAMEAISIRSLQEISATVVHPDGREELMDARLLQYGDCFKVSPDSSIITDGIVRAGHSDVDESMMTGESLPVEKAPGSIVIAGTANGPSTLLVDVTRLPGENTISDIAGMVDAARFSRARVQETVDLICGWFVPVVLALAIITFVVCLAVGLAVRGQSAGAAAVAALTYAIAVLAISCPCAVGLAVPMVILVAGGVAAQRGLVFKAATTIEAARTVTHVVFDKTGTLTQGCLAVVQNEVVADGPELDVQAAVAALVEATRHPVARAVAAHLASAGVRGRVAVEGIEMVTGKGIRGTLDGRELRGGSARWLELEEHPVVRALLLKGLTTFCVAYDGRLLAAFGLEDTLRPETASVMKALGDRGVRVSVLSGDHPAAVEKVTARLGIAQERVRAACLPADKQAYIKQLVERGEKVLFCGDGTNDAVALAQADIGVHLHTGAGAGVAASAAADVVLIHASLWGILALFELSEAVARRIALNFAWAAVYNLVAILLAGGAFVRARIPPAYAGLGEVVSVVPVVLVALQLKWFKWKVCLRG
ncbi:P-type cation-transporting ATPase [Grifola frondosa]|uniref:P-type cation-transporting ATPase n=1 Tax=Grifola frondosa TaxID=5627 RepID=A0A1C7MAR7_GRIFR|nr:P-type cation-transporting ATPase [Grifola frondosa]